MPMAPALWQYFDGLPSDKGLIMLITIIAFAICYLLGSISSAVIISRFSGKQDPREAGSGNPGATNVLRLSGNRVAAYVLCCDLAKGLVAVYLASSMGLHGFMLGLAAVAVTLGHIFPIFFAFKGGKGVATALGAIIALSLWVGLLAILTWLILAAIFRYASLASLIAAIASPFYMLAFQHPPFFIPCCILAAIIIWRHLNNIKRLKTGTEKKIYFKQT